MDDPRRRFTMLAGEYAAARPGYPLALVDRVLALAGVTPPGRVADLGAGTGLASRAFAGRGLAVEAIEPNPAMRERAEPHPAVRWHATEAAATGLPAGSIDLAVAAQSFHWFETGPVLVELGRILAPGGALATIWNVRAASPFLDAYDALLRERVEGYDRVARMGPAVARLRADPRVRPAGEARAPNPQRLDRAGLRARAWSSSYVAHGVADRAGFDRALDRLFDEHAVAGEVAFDYDAIGYVWRLAG